MCQLQYNTTLTQSQKRWPSQFSLSLLSMKSLNYEPWFFSKQISSKICARSIRRTLGSNKVYLLNILFFFFTIWCMKTRPAYPQLQFSSSMCIFDFFGKRTCKKKIYIYMHCLPRYTQVSILFVTVYLKLENIHRFIGLVHNFCLYFILTLLFKTLTLPRRSRYTSSIESVLQYGQKALLYKLYYILHKKISLQCIYFIDFFLQSSSIYSTNCR